VRAVINEIETNEQQQQKHTTNQWNKKLAPWKNQ
jgi:hypothetical protein